MIKCSKIKYPDGIGYCIYRVKNSDEDSGSCFDISGDEETDEIINILQEYRNKEPEIYTPDTKYEKYIKKKEIRNDHGLHTMTKGIYLGPICITW